MIKVPTQAQLDAAAGAFADDWSLVDDVLYGVCRQYPTHTVRGQVVAKVAIVGRAYAGRRRALHQSRRRARRRRHVLRGRPPLRARQQDVDDIVETVSLADEPLDARRAWL